MGNKRENNGPTYQDGYEAGLAAWHTATAKATAPRATKIVEALQSQKSRDPEDEVPVWPDAPSEMPVIVVDRFYSDDTFADTIPVAHTLGQYGTEKFPNELGSHYLNIGFYAGVLAVKLGIVDPEQFNVITSEN